VSKGIDEDVAAAQVRKSFNLGLSTTQNPGPKPGPKTPPAGIIGMKKPTSGNTPTENTAGSEQTVEGFFANLEKKVQAEQRRRGA